MGGDGQPGLIEWFFLLSWARMHHKVVGNFGSEADV